MYIYILCYVIIKRPISKAYRRTSATLHTCQHNHHPLTVGIGFGQCATLSRSKINLKSILLCIHQRFSQAGHKWNDTLQ